MGEPLDAATRAAAYKAWKARPPATWTRPELLAEVERLRAENESLKSEIAILHRACKPDGGAS